MKRWARKPTRTTGPSGDGLARRLSAKSPSVNPSPPLARADGAGGGSGGHCAHIPREIPTLGTIIGPPRSMHTLCASVCSYRGGGGTVTLLVSEKCKGLPMCSYAQDLCVVKSVYKNNM